MVVEGTRVVAKWVVERDWRVGTWAGRAQEEAAAAAVVGLVAAGWEAEVEGAGYGLALTGWSLRGTPQRPPEPPLRARDGMVGGDAEPVATSRVGLVEIYGQVSDENNLATRIRADIHKV